MKKNYSSTRWFFVSVLVFASAFALLFEPIAVAGGHLARRQRSAPQQLVRSDVAESKPHGTNLRGMSLEDYCAALKADAKKPTEADLARCRTRLAAACHALGAMISRDPNREAATYWRNTLLLDELIATLRSDQSPDIELLRMAENAFQSDKKGVRWLVFDDARKELRRYLTVHSIVDANNFDEQISNICDNLVNYVQVYSSNTDPGYGTALGTVFRWLEDISVFEPRAAKLSTLALADITRTNVHFHASNAFLAAGFETEIDETVDIRETINGTQVIGTGEISASSEARLVPARNGGNIQVLVNATMNSTTTGYHPPVTLNTKTTGTLYTEKLIRLSPSLISTVPARTRANLNSTIYNIRINAGPVVQCIAKSRIEQERGASFAAARSRTEQRMSERVDRRVDERISELNDRYQKQVRQPLLKAGLFPRVWNVASSSNMIDSLLLLGTTTQPGAPSCPTITEDRRDLFVQVHQSALNNLAVIALAGRAFEEEKVMEDLKEQFGELPDALKRDDSQKPLHVTFAPQEPIAISLVDNRIKAIFRIDAFIQEGTSYPGLDITLLYDVKTLIQKDADGQERALVVFEQAEAPQANARGKQSVSSRELAIRTIVLRRLESSLPKRFEGEPRELKGEWEGAGKLVPAFASSVDGWLTLAWDWVPN